MKFFEKLESFRLMHRHVHDTRRDGIHPNPLSRVFNGERLGDGLQPSFGQIRQTRSNTGDRLTWRFLSSYNE
jgi:hypothetical protein